MWKCHKCGKPVYFAERKQSLGYDWHPECLRCEECAKRLNPGQHAEHKGIPYCHVPCYGALFGPQLYGHGTRVESHTSFGKVENKTVGRNMPRSHLESKLKLFNQFYEGKSNEIRCREVNGRLVLEGALRIYWGVSGVIHLKEDDDQRTVVTIRKRNSCRHSFFNGFNPEDEKVENGGRGGDREAVEGNCDKVNKGVGKERQPSVEVRRVSGSHSDEELGVVVGEEPTSPSSNLAGRCLTLPSKLDIKNIKWDQLDQLLKVERCLGDSEKLYQTLPSSLPSVYDFSPTGDDIGQRLDDSTASDSSNSYRSSHRSFDRSQSNPEKLSEGGGSGGSSGSEGDADEAEGRRKAKRRGPTAIRRRPGGRRRHAAKLRRRCSINGHFYNRETSFFTPPRGSQASVWVTSLVSSCEVINLLLDKYKVDSNPNQFALFVIRDNGEQRMLKEDEYPLMVRVMLGPHEDVAKLYLVDRKTTDEISPEVAQFLNLTLVECNAILDRYTQEELREQRRILLKYREMYRLMKLRLEELRNA